MAHQHSSHPRTAPPRRTTTYRPQTRRPVDVATSDAQASEYVRVLPGGVTNPDQLRLDTAASQLLQESQSVGEPSSHLPQTLDPHHQSSTGGPRGVQQRHHHQVRTAPHAECGSKVCRTVASL